MGAGPFLLALLFLVIGIAMLAMPDTFRAMNKFGNDLDGVKTEQGPLYDLNRKVCGVLLIIGGIVVLAVLALG